MLNDTEPLKLNGELILGVIKQCPVSVQSALT